MATSSTSERVPKPMQPTFTAIVALTDAFCRAHLDEEYAQLARQATAALCRKRPSPLATGNLKTWACGIVYALAACRKESAMANYKALRLVRSRHLPRQTT